MVTRPLSIVPFVDVFITEASISEPKVIGTPSSVSVVVCRIWICTGLSTRPSLILLVLLVWIRSPERAIAECM